MFSVIELFPVLQTLMGYLPGLRIVLTSIHWTLPSILFLFWISVRQAAHRQSLLFSMHFDMLSCQANFEYVMSIAIDSFRHSPIILPEITRNHSQIMMGDADTFFYKNLTNRTEFRYANNISMCCYYSLQVSNG